MDNIQARITAAGHTYTTLAAAIGVTEQAVRQWAWGTRQPSAENAAKVDDVLGPAPAGGRTE